MDNLIVIVVLEGKKGTQYYRHFSNDKPKSVKALRTWGEDGVVNLKSTSTPNTICKFAFLLDMQTDMHDSGNCCHMFNPTTKRYTLLYRDM